jgi:hypothetical protein
MVPRPVSIKKLDNINDLPKKVDRIQLPFVSKGATWIDDNENDEERRQIDSDQVEEVEEEGLVLTMVPPLHHEEDTILVRYGKDLEPRLEHVGGGYHYDSANEVQQVRDLDAS